MNCKQCNSQTANPSFCSRSCAASFNNVRFPKRKLETICKRCNGMCWSGRSYCQECWYIVAAERSILKWEQTTLDQMKGLGNANAGGRYPYIRGLARKKYLLSDKPKYCIVCGYDRHFDVSHIKDVRSYPLTATIAEINHIDNLQALCKNHHWEFDHDK